MAALFLNIYSISDERDRSARPNYESLRFQNGRKLNWSRAEFDDDDDVTKGGVSLWFGRQFPRVCTRSI